MVLVLAACPNVPESAPFPIEDITVGDNVLRVWVADESEERQQGLMDLDQIPRGIDGILFSWPTPVSATFTMTDTLIPLDIWWIDADGVVIGSATMEPCPDGNCVSYGSPGPVLWALETAEAMVDIEVGDVFSTTGSS